MPRFGYRLVFAGMVLALAAGCATSYAPQLAANEQACRGPGFIGEEAQVINGQCVISYEHQRTGPQPSISQPVLSNEGGSPSL
jgi:hypothetical protein